MCYNTRSTTLILIDVNKIHKFSVIDSILFLSYSLFLLTAFNEQNGYKQLKSSQNDLIVSNSLQAMWKLVPWYFLLLPPLTPSSNLLLMPSKSFWSCDKSQDSLNRALCCIQQYPSPPMEKQIRVSLGQSKIGNRNDSCWMVNSQFQLLIRKSKWHCSEPQAMWRIYTNQLSMLQEKKLYDQVRRTHNKRKIRE